ncbi:MAG: ABC transporter substrate-binding protein, partial [Desulfobulbaceae bacterium]|nr:ABC transporter substrate-binding protein [Desulfobulbaceae bacterium]
MPDEKSTVRLGLLAPLTGLVKLYGPEISHAGLIACAEVNETGGVLGRPLELIILDDGSLPDTAVPAAEQLIKYHECAAIIGNLLSNSRISVSNLVTGPLKIPHLNFSFYEGSISDRYYFHFAALPNQQIDKMIPYMAKKFGPKIFFAGSNYEWPRGSIDAGKRVLAEIGGEVVGEEYLPIGADDFDILLDNIATSGADVFVPYFAGLDQINLLTEFTRRGLKKRMAVVMGHYDEAMTAQLEPEVRQDFYSVNTYFMSVDTESNRNYLKQLAALPDVTGIHPEGNGLLTNFGEGTYICVKAFAEAVNKAGSLDAESLVSALETISVSGPQGTVTMDPLTHHATVNSYLSRCNADSTFSIISSFGPIAPVIPERYRSTQRHPQPLETNEAVRSIHFEQLSKKHRASIAMCIFSSCGRISFTNNTFKRLWRCEEKDSPEGRPTTELWTLPVEFEKISQTIREMGEWTGEITALPFDGTNLQLKSMIEPVANFEKPKGEFILYCIDPAAKSLFEQNIGVSDQILSLVDVAVIVVNTDSNIIQVNNAAHKLFGYDKDELIGLSVHMLVPPNMRERHKEHFAKFMKSNIRELPMGRRGKIAGYRKEGSNFPAEASLCKIKSSAGTMVVATVNDISEHVKQERDLIWKATHDPLTNLPNRALISERIDNALQRSARKSHGIALLFIDLDDFKLVNDSFGHHVGD